jgi:LPXTG-site transpeptidase (sortase) family protein
MAWRPRLSHVVIGAGLGVILLGGGVLLAPYLDAARWQSSPEAARAQRNADVSAPVWIEPTATGVAAAAVAVQPTSSPPVASTPVPAPTPVPQLGAPIALLADIAAAPTPTPSTSDLRLSSSAFVFDDPPQPGAHAHLDLTIHNPTDDPADSVSLTLPTAWLAGYRLESTIPSLVDGVQSSSELRLSFAGPPPNTDLDVSLAFVTTDEVVDAPSTVVYDALGREVGRAQPRTQAPPAQPGPIYSIDIPRLKLHAGVVPVEWEPPLFVVGQLRTSAWVTRGNSVLVGHVRGAAGYNVFINLDQLKLGDEIVASSRGEAYTFRVTQTEVLAEDDTSPTEPTSGSRLTLMTCAGDWNPLTQDYTNRLWVVAEPDDNQADGQATAAANASTPNR